MVESKSQHMKNILFIFDYDFSLIDDSSYNFLGKNLLSDDEYNKIFSTTEMKAWDIICTEFMKTIESKNIPEEKLKEIITKIPLTTGMVELIKYIANLKTNEKNIRLEVIIASGSNSKFIEWTLNTNNIHEIIDFIASSVYSYENVEINGERIHKYSLKDWHEHSCSECYNSLCKGTFFKDFLEKKEEEEKITYDKIFYICDGDNDICGAKALNSVKEAFIFIRNCYDMHNIIYDNKNRLKEEYKKLITSKLFLWDNGEQILKIVKESI